MLLQLQTPLWVMPNAMVSAGRQLAGPDSHKAMLAQFLLRAVANASAVANTTVGDAERDCLCRAPACRLHFSQGHAGGHLLQRAVANASAVANTTAGDAERGGLCRAPACRLHFSQGHAG